MNRRTLLNLLALALIVWPCLSALAGPSKTPAAAIAELIQPAKLATLGPRRANPRVQKAVYWIETARRAGQDITNLVTVAVAQAGYTNTLAAQLTRDALLRNLKIATGYGCLDTEGMAEMRKGNAPTIRRGKYLGDQLSVDHIVPRAVCPELDNVIANLKLVQLCDNESKNDNLGLRQFHRADELHLARVLSVERLNKIQGAQL